MDNFDFKKYLKEGRINKDFSQLDEKKEDSKKGNKEEQKRLEGAIRDNRDHKFDIDKDEDDQRKKLAKLQKDAKKEDGKGKKGNKDEQKRAEGAIKDAKDHKKALNKDIKADEKKLAKLKKDFKKDVIKEEFKSDEADKAYDSLDNAINDFRKMSNDAFGGAKQDVYSSAAGDKMKEFDKAYQDLIVSLKDIDVAMNEISEKKQGYNDRDDEAIGAKDGAEKDKKVSMKGRRDMSRGMEKALGNRPDSTDSKMDEDQVEEYGKKPMYDEDDVKPMKESSKMKKSELKAKIKETILAELSLAESGFEASDAGSQYHDSLYTEEEDVDVDVDFEDEVNVDAEGDDIEIEKPAVKAKVQVGLSPEETIVQDSLKAAMDAADALGNDKLADQIGNTITFFTREYVVGRNSD